MRVALDVSIQSRSDPTGVERAQLTLLEGLASLPDGPELHLVGASDGWLPPLDAATVHLGGGGALWRQTGLPALLRALTVDVFHGPVAAVPALAPCPVVASLHDLPWAEEQGPRGDDEGPARHRLATTLAARSAAALLVPSRRTANQLLRLHPDAAARVHVVPHGLGGLPHVDPVAARAALALDGVPAPGEYLLALGRRRPRKNLEALVAAFGLAPAGAVPAVLVLAGPPGAADDSLRHAACAPALKAAGRRVVFTDYVDRSWLPELIVGARALVSPSLFEGYGLPALEAMALGTPVLTARQGVVDEVAEGAALRVDGRSVDVLASALTMICGDEMLRAQLVEAGLRRAAERSALAMARDTLAVYEVVA